MLTLMSQPQQMTSQLYYAENKYVKTVTTPSDYCIPVASAHTRQHLSSANDQQLAVPRYQLNTYGHCAFSVGTTVWNFIPVFIRDPTISADCFRRLLKTYLFTQY